LSFKEEWLNGFQDKSTKQFGVAQVLSDMEWHCRGHEYSDIESGQLAGGGGIQGLERGTQSREGLLLEKKRDTCKNCEKKTTWDKWTGEYASATAPSVIPPSLITRILEHYDYTDSIEGRKRPTHELVVDHRFPMVRWGGKEPPNDPEMSDCEIEKKFQLLKFDGGGNHNLLKSRDCERCLDTGERGTPFGISFFYEGNKSWKKGIPDKGEGAEDGCVGCGWYDFAKWKDELNKKLNQ